MLTRYHPVLIYLILGLLVVIGSSVVLANTDAVDSPPVIIGVSLAGFGLVLVSTAILVRQFQREQSYVRASTQTLTQTDERARLLFASNPRPMWIFGRDSGRFLAVNDAALRHYGYTRAEFLQLTIFDIRPPGGDAELRAHLDLITEKGIPLIRQGQHRRKDGEILYVEAETYPIDYHGEPCFMAVIQDMSAQVEAERALQASESRYRAVSELISDYAYSFRVNPDGTFEDEWVTADSFARITGYVWEELDPNGPLTLFHPAEAAALTQEQELLRQGETVSRDYRIITKSGEERWLHIARRPQWDDEHNRIIRFYGIAQDITDRKQYEEQLEYQANLINHVSDAIISTDETQRITSWNHAAEIIYGWTPAEAIGHTPTELSSFDYLTTTREQVVKQIWTQGSWQGEAIHRRKDGTLIWILSSVTALRDTNGQVIGSVAINRDITERKTAEEAAREYQRFREAVADVSAALTSTLDLRSVLERILSNVGRVVPHDAANIMLVQKTGEGTEVRFASWHGYDPALDDYFPAQRLSVRKYGLDRMYTTGLPDLVENTDDRPNWNHLPGQPWVRSCVGVPIHTDDQVIGFLNLDSRTAGFFTPHHAERLQLFANQAAVALRNAQLYEQVQSHAADLERRIDERTLELRNALDKERELGQLKMRFVSMVSHEFRTPLAIIQSSRDLLKRYSDRYTPERRAEQFDEIQAQVWHMTRMLEDFLTLSGAESDNLKFAPVQLDLVSFIDSLVRELQPVHPDHPLHFHTDAQPIPAQVDPRLIRQTLTNLISNSAKYSPRDSIIDIDLSVHDGTLMLKVRDEGIGIPDDDQRHLFEVFHRGTNVGTVPGTGLGLSIVRRAVDAHGGTVSLQSRVGQGTTVILMLPTTPSVSTLSNDGDHDF